MAAQWIVEGPLACTDEQMYTTAGKPQQKHDCEAGRPNQTEKWQGGRGVWWIMSLDLMPLCLSNTLCISSHCYEPESFYCGPAPNERLGPLNPSV